MKIYTISGLGADKRVFDFLNLEGELVHLDWLDPKRGEALEDYSLRLSKMINTKDDFVLMGVSFGGLVATEICKVVEPKLCILLSSVELSSELPLIARAMGRLRFTRRIPSVFYTPPTRVVQWLFQTKHKSLLNQILKETDAGFAKWALNEVFSWKNKTRIKEVLKISGTKEYLLPITQDANTVLVEGGAHFMIVDKADEVSAIINEHLKKL